MIDGAVVEGVDWMNVLFKQKQPHFFKTKQTAINSPINYNISCEWFSSTKQLNQYDIFSFVIVVYFIRF